MILLIAFSGKVKLQKIEHYYWLKFKDAETIFQKPNTQIFCRRPYSEQEGITSYTK